MGIETNPRCPSCGDGVTSWNPLYYRRITNDFVCDNGHVIELREVKVQLPRPCPYMSCVQCGACAVCRDFHGDHYGGCTDLNCPYRWYHKLRDWWRRWLMTLRK